MQVPKTRITAVLNRATGWYDSAGQAQQNLSIISCLECLLYTFIYVFKRREGLHQNIKATPALMRTPAPLLSRVTSPAANDGATDEPKTFFQRVPNSWFCRMAS